MRERDWTPAVLVTSALCFFVATVAGATSPLLRLGDSEPGPERARRLPPPEVSAWVGDLAPGLKGVLVPVWGDPEPDRLHDEELNHQLRAGLAYYRLLVFNTSGAERTLRLGDGALTIRPPGAGDAVTSRSLSTMLARGEINPSAGTKAVLGALGALEEEVTVSSGSMTSLLVPFGRHVDLAAAASVAAGDGTPFRRRPMQRAELQDLLYDGADEDRVKDL
jgi:hypothetical protein